MNQVKWREKDEEKNKKRDLLFFFVCLLAKLNVSVEKGAEHDKLHFLLSLLYHSCLFLQHSFLPFIVATCIWCCCITTWSQINNLKLFLMSLPVFKTAVMVSKAQCSTAASLLLLFWYSNIPGSCPQLLSFQFQFRLQSKDWVWLFLAAVLRFRRTGTSTAHCHFAQDFHLLALYLLLLPAAAM